MNDHVHSEHAMQNKVHVFFDGTISPRDRHVLATLSSDTVVVMPKVLHKSCSVPKAVVVALEDFMSAGSIYDAHALLEELSLLTFKDGTRITKTSLYKGYELWWNNYNTLFIASCIPYTQYNKLLAYLVTFGEVHMHTPPHASLFQSYLEGYGVQYTMHREVRAHIPFGIMLQSVLSVVSVLVRTILRKPALVFTGDKFEREKDHDPRMRDLYEALRERKIPFVEVVRSLESWKTVLEHAWTRRRPVVYAVPYIFWGRVISYCTGAGYRSKRALRARIQATTMDPRERFKWLLATSYIEDASADVWAIRMATFSVWLMGIRSAFFTKVSDRNFHFFIACKQRGIKTVGILHGVASRYYNVYDFVGTYDGEKQIGLDAYGVWSSWWKEYYVIHSKAYTASRLFVAGPMRPLVSKREEQRVETKGGREKAKVLFVSEQLAVPEEVLPFLEALLRTPELEVYMKFRPYRDGFELWLKEHHEEILESVGEEHIMRGTMQDAIRMADVVVGSHSTAVLEALLVGKPIVFFKTKKWGDYFELRSYESEHTLYADEEDVFIRAVLKAHTMTPQVITDLAQRFFGDPYQNGSAWAVAELEAALHE